MLAKQVDISAPYRPLPISYLICTARQFSCDIFLQGITALINVKDYNDMMNNRLDTQGNLTFYLHGEDENDAGQRITQIFKL